MEFGQFLNIILSTVATDESQGHKETQLSKTMLFSFL